MMTVEEIVRLFRPWRRRYSSIFGEPTRRQVSEDTCYDDERVLWITPSAESLRSSPVFESFALLALLGCIDKTEWEEQIEAIWTRRRGAVHLFNVQVLRAARNDSPLIGFNVAINSINASTIGELTDRISPYQSVSPDYNAVYCDIERAIVGTKSMDGCSVDMRTPVRVLCTSPSIQERAQILHRVFQLACGQDHDINSTLTKTAMPMQRAMFHARARIVEVCVDGVVNLEGLIHLKNLRDVGIQVHKMPQVDVSDVYPAAPFMFQLLQDLIPQNDSARPGVQRVVVGCGTLDHCIPRVMSALRFSHSVTCVEIECTNFDDDSEQHVQKHHDILRWLAYALFSNGATHTISKIILKTRLNVYDVIAFQNVLAATNPLSKVIAGECSSQPQGQVHAGRFYWSQPSGDAANSDTQLWTSSTAVIADVIKSPSHGSQWWRVLLPGYGRALVHTDDVIRHDPGSSLPSSPKITALEVITKHTLDALPHLLQSIGGSLKSILFIASPQLQSRVRFPQLWFEGVFNRCPSLDTLVLQREIQGPSVLKAIADAATATSCQLRRFESGFAYTNATDAADLAAFLLALSDGSHLFSRRLERVRLTVCPVDEDDEDGLAFVKPVLAMLDANRHLAHFALEVRQRHDQIEVLEDLGFDRYTEAPQQEITATLSSKCKLAFLSVLTGLSRGATAVGRLDSAMAGHILIFAGSQFTRTVVLTYSRYNEDGTECDAYVDDYADDALSESPSESDSESDSD